MVKLFENYTCCNLTKQILNHTTSSVIIEQSSIQDETVPQSITLQIHNNNRNYAHGRSFKDGQIKWIVVHYTACVNVSAKSMCKSMVNNTDASSHFYVDENDIYPSVPLTHVAWHVGGGACKQPDSEHKKSLKELSSYKSKDWRYDLAASNHLKWQSANDDFVGNYQSIGVDICVKKVSNKTKKATDLDWYFEPEAIENTAKLVAYLAKKYNIDMDHIIRHGDATGKLCPQPFAWPPEKGDQSWSEFKNLVYHYMSYNIDIEKID